MKIVICDDCIEDIKYLRGLIKANNQCPADVDFYEYLSGEELLDQYQKFDIVFLDMQMNGMDGKETAEKIREHDSEVVLSFYSGYEVSAHKILDSRPSRYLMKGSSEEKLNKDIDKVLIEALSKKQTIQIRVQYYGNTVVLNLSEILYISIYNKGSLVWVTDKKAIELWGAKDKVKEPALKSGTSVKAYYEDLKDYGFIYASVSYIVNAENVLAQTTNSITLKSGFKLTVARSLKKKFEEEFGKFWDKKYNMRRL